MSETTTLDRPAETAETEAETPDETGAAQSGTADQDEAVQPDTSEVEERPEETPEQHEAKLDADRIAAERAEAVEADRRDRETQRLADEKAADAKAAETEQRQTFVREISKAEAEFARMENEYSFGEDVRPEWDKFKADVLNGYRNIQNVAVKNAHLSLADDYEADFDDLLGKEKADAVRATISDKDGNYEHKDFVRAAADELALQAKPIKSMTLEQAKSASPVLARELATALKHEFSEGRKHPEAEGEPGGDGGAGYASPYRTLADAEAAHVRGDITNAEMRRLKGANRW